MIFRQLILDQIHFHYLNHTRLVLKENFNIINVMLLVTILAQHNVAMLELFETMSQRRVALKIVVANRLV